LQHWRLSPWRPSTASMRALAQSAFVDEDGHLLRAPRDKPLFAADSQLENPLASEPLAIHIAIRNSCLQRTSNGWRCRQCSSMSLKLRLQRCSVCRQMEVKRSRKQQQNGRVAV
jgi:hypothetical protein